MKIAYNAHHGQGDWVGIPYIYHPIHLAEQMDDEVSTCVALLHDVVEDTDITFEDLMREGFGKEVIDALTLLTHEPGVDYMEYVGKIKSNPIATKVKLADLRHNSDLTRLDEINEKAIIYNEKYKNAIKFLES